MILHIYAVLGGAAVARRPAQTSIPIGYNLPARNLPARNLPENDQISNADDIGRSTLSQLYF